MTPSAIVIEPFHISGFRLRIGQYALTLRGYIATSRFGVHLTLLDSLRMWWLVDKTILKDIGMYKDVFLVTGDCEDKM